MTIMYEVDADGEDVDDTDTDGEDVDDTETDEEGENVAAVVQEADEEGENVAAVVYEEDEDGTTPPVNTQQNVSCVLKVPDEYVHP